MCEGNRDRPVIDIGHFQPFHRTDLCRCQLHRRLHRTAVGVEIGHCKVKACLVWKNCRNFPVVLEPVCSHILDFKSVFLCRRNHFLCHCDAAGTVVRYFLLLCILVLKAVRQPNRLTHCHFDLFPGNRRRNCRDGQRYLRIITIVILVLRIVPHVDIHGLSAIEVDTLEGNQALVANLGIS